MGEVIAFLVLCSIGGIVMNIWKRNDEMYPDERMGP